MRHLLTLLDLKSSEIDHIFSIAQDLKDKSSRGLREPLLPGRVMALVFEKPSLRTRVSFEAAMTHLGGGSVFLGQEAGFGKRESIEDFGRVLSTYADVIVARVFAHDTVVQLAKYSTCSVVNGLSDLSHPCQALADLFTLRERFGTFDGLSLAYIGDANNVARSLAVCCAKLGVSFRLGAPKGYQFDEDFLKRLKDTVPSADVVVTADPLAAAEGVTAVYTDVWTSMGQEDESEIRRKALANYQVNAAVMKKAGAGAVFMHCLPAKRGEEVSGEVIDGAQSIVVDQAANRMHLQKGLLAWLLASQAR